ncbi:MAG: hypothetical protein R2710_21315 [Acidimicrobiales bacterium]
MVAIGIVAAGCTSGSDEALDGTTTSTPTSASTTDDAATADGLTQTFVAWYNTITSGDAPAPTCGEAPVWVAAESLKPSSSGPLLVCADRTANDELVLRIVNNASGPLSIDYPDASAGWVVGSDDPDGVVPLRGATGALVRPGASATLTAAAGEWDEQDLSLEFGERWAIIEATNELMGVLGLDSTFDWASDLADGCEVDAVADADLGAPLEAGLHDYFECVFDALGGAATAADRASLADVVPMVAELVERARNVASQQRAGVVPAALLIVSELPEPAGPSIESTTSTTAAPTTTRPPTTRATTTTVPSTAAPTTPAPTTAPSTTTTTGPKKVTTTEEDPDLTVPVPPAPVLVALEAVEGGVDTYTAWPAIDPKLGRIPGGQIVVIECKVFTDSPTPGGNGWWYRIGSGAAAGGWAPATGFKNLVAGVAPGSTSPSNVSDALSAC